MPLPVLWILFILLALIHLFTCYRDLTRLRDGTKSLLLLFLAALYLCGARHFRPMVLAALLLGCLGDTLLIWGERGSAYQLQFFGGAAAFALGHLAYLAALCSIASPLAAPAFLIPAFGLMLLGPALLFLKIRHGIPALFRYPSMLYGVIIALMAALALQFLYCTRTLPSLLIGIGMLCFVLSDSLLTYCMFGKKQKTPDLYGTVMLFYILAQGLLTEGFSLLP